jgi:hypothetical protein
MNAELEKELTREAEKGTLDLLTERAKAHLKAGNRRAARYALLVAAKMLQDAV